MRRGLLVKHLSPHVSQPRGAGCRGCSLFCYVKFVVNHELCFQNKQGDFRSSSKRAKVRHPAGLNTADRQSLSFEAKPWQTPSTGRSSRALTVLQQTIWMQHRSRLEKTSTRSPSGSRLGEGKASRQLQPQRARAPQGLPLCTFRSALCPGTFESL